VLLCVLSVFSIVSSVCVMLALISTVEQPEVVFLTRAQLRRLLEGDVIGTTMTSHTDVSIYLD